MDGILDQFSICNCRVNMKLLRWFVVSFLVLGSLSVSVKINKDVKTIFGKKVEASDLNLDILDRLKDFDGCNGLAAPLVGNVTLFLSALTKLVPEDVDVSFWGYYFVAIITTLTVCLALIMLDYFVVFVLKCCGWTFPRGN